VLYSTINVTVRLLAIVVLLLIAGCSAQHAAAPLDNTSGPIFRYVDLGVLGRFELGEYFGDHARLTVEEQPNTYRLREGTFEGAESIVVVTDESTVVRRIKFEYGPSYDWTTVLSNYVELLGPPVQNDESKAAWNDGLTEFFLTREPGEPYAAGAEMRDLSGSY